MQTFSSVIITGPPISSIPYGTAAKIPGTLISPALSLTPSRVSWIALGWPGKLIIKEEIDINNFFSFLAAMMLSYQPVRSLATLNIAIQQGLAGAKRVLPIIDDKPKIKDNQDAKELIFKDAEIKFENVDFKYTNNYQTLNSVNLKFLGKKMTALVGHSGAGKSTILNLIPRFYNIDSGDIKTDNQSIYKSSISGWKKYEKHLTPMFNKLSESGCFEPWDIENLN